MGVNGWLFDAPRHLWIRGVDWDDIDAAANLARRAFSSAETGTRVRQMLGIHLAMGAGDIPLERQHHSMLPSRYYLMVQRETPHEAAIGLTGLYTRPWDEEKEGNYWLGWLAVDPQFQKQGFGEHLLTATLAICAAKGGKRLNIETSIKLLPARRLYQRLGFTEVPTIPDYWGRGGDLLILYREIGPGEFQHLTPPEGSAL